MAAAAIEYFGRSGLFHDALVPRAFISDKCDMQLLTFPLKMMVDFALPARCPGCGTITVEQDQFCTTCWQKLQLLSQPACATCDLPLPFSGHEGAQCASCMADPPRHSGIKAAVAYGDIARDIVLQLKHGGKIGVARLVAYMLRRHLDAIPEQALIVPVPLHWTRLWRRRYNQSALIAQELARLAHAEHVPDLLQRVRRTSPLGGLGARARAAMVKGAFRLHPKRGSKLKGRAVVLVDDVYTSGATTDACVSTLLKGGAQSVTIFCWARVLPEALEQSLD